MVRIQTATLIVFFWTSLVSLAGAAWSTPISFPDDFTLELASEDFGRSAIVPEFSNVRTFQFSIDVEGPLEPNRLYGNEDLTEIRYLVRGALSLNPATPSGFPAFSLSRLPSGEGPISPEDWESQSSRLAFEIARDANLLDGIQLSELVAGEAGGLILEINAREFERLDVARYHPPELRLYADGTGLLRNSNNSSGETDTVNPATGERVDVAFGEEYITRLRFDPAAITLIASPPAVPEPGTGLLLAFGLAGLSRHRPGRFL